MQALAVNPSMFAIFFGGAWEVVLFFSVILILFAAKKLPEITRGLGDGVSRFRKAVGGLSKDLDQEAYDAGESLGGVYGKSAAQALTPDNQTAELYDPAVFHNKGVASKRMKFRGWSRLWRLIWCFVFKRLNRKI
jgi:sec-independent protein translocase protein TatA